jgi:hypothetical protein
VQSGHLAHAIIYTGYQPPDRLPLEENFSKKPICVVPTDPTEALSADSRINFGKPTPVEHNLRIKHIGDIHTDDMHRLIRYYEWENNTDSVLESVGLDPSTNLRSPNPGFRGTSEWRSRSTLQNVNEHIEMPRTDRRSINSGQAYLQGATPISSLPHEMQQDFRGEGDPGRGRRNTSPAERSIQHKPQHNRSVTDSSDYRRDKKGKAKGYH